MSNVIALKNPDYIQAPALNRAIQQPSFIYLASRYDRLAEMQQVKFELERAAHFVTSRWVLGYHDMNEDAKGEDGDKWRALFAQEDHDDVLRADTIINFTEPLKVPSRRGGRHVELGIALGRGHRIIVVGPQENVFHYLPHLERYDTWEEAKYGTGLVKP